MKKEKIKSLPIIEDFIIYIVRRAKRVLKIKDSEFKSISIDVHPERGTIWVWFHMPEKVIARVQFYVDGRCYEKSEYRE